MDKIWQLKVPAHVGGDECYFECYLAAVETKAEVIDLIREHGYLPEHVEMRQIENVHQLGPGVFCPDRTAPELDHA